MVSLPEGIWNIIDNDLDGLIGDGDSEIIKNMIFKMYRDILENYQEFSHSFL